jgi:voltage-dependent calcium channel L type alpha-1D
MHATATTALTAAATDTAAAAVTTHYYCYLLQVFLSIMELALSPPSFAINSHRAPHKSSAVSSFRSFRLLRVFKLAHKWQQMRSLLSTIYKTVFDVANFALLLVIFMFIYALIGLQFFANRLHFDDRGYAVSIGASGWADADVPRSNFDDLHHAFVTVFQLLTSENWNLVMVSSSTTTIYMQLS